MANGRKSRSLRSLQQRRQRGIGSLQALPQQPGLGPAPVTQLQGFQDPGSSGRTIQGALGQLSQVNQGLQSLGVNQGVGAIPGVGRGLSQLNSGFTNPGTLSGLLGSLGGSAAPTSFAAVPAATSGLAATGAAPLVGGAATGALGGAAAGGAGAAAAGGGLGGLLGGLGALFALI